MKNPTKNISVYKITGRICNPLMNNEPWNEAIIPITWSKSGVARAWWVYSDHTLATAGGYGYDKESTVLARALVALGVDDEVRQGEGVGVGRVMELASKHGVVIAKLV